MTSKLGLRDTFSILKEAGSDFIDDNASTLGAAVSFYAALSLAPLLLLLLSFTSFLGPDQQRSLVSELTRLIGPEVGQTVDLVIDSAKSEPGKGLFSRVAGFVTLLFSASAVFAELQFAMNTIWNVKSKAEGVWGFLRARLLSLGLVVTLGFLLLISMVASAVLSATVHYVSGAEPGEALLWRVIDAGSSFVLYAAVFATMYKILPDVRLAWRNVIAGSLITSVLFVIGKMIVGLYLGSSSTASAYGAAGSLVVMLGWVYYSAQIVFFGAEITQVVAARRGEAIVPTERAELIHATTDARTA